MNGLTDLLVGVTLAGPALQVGGGKFGPVVSAFGKPPGLIVSIAAPGGEGGCVDVVAVAAADVEGAGAVATGTPPGKFCATVVG